MALDINRTLNMMSVGYLKRPDIRSIPIFYDTFIMWKDRRTHISKYLKKNNNIKTYLKSGDLYGGGGNVPP